MNPSPDRKIPDILGEGRFTLSAEIVPPRNGSDPAAILHQISSLKDAGAQFMAVTKGAGGALRGGSLPIAQTIKERFQMPCIAHFTCRDLLPEEVENQLVDHHFFGIRNILALRGDPPQGVAQWRPREGSYSHAYQLAEQIRALNEGRYLERSGFKVDSRQRTDFCVGVACYPDHQDPRERGEFFELKINAGAEFAISQMLFDVDSYSRFLDATAKLGPAGRGIPILPGTRILKSKAQATKMSKRFEIPIPSWYTDLLPDTDADANADASQGAFLTLTERLRKAGAPGMHIFVLSDTEPACFALQALWQSNGSCFAEEQEGPPPVSSL